MHKINHIKKKKTEINKAKINPRPKLKKEGGEIIKLQNHKKKN